MRGGGCVLLQWIRFERHADSTRRQEQADSVAGRDAGIQQFGCDSVFTAACWEKLLSAFRAQPTVERAVMYSVDGEVIATYPADSARRIPSVESLLQGSWQDQDGRLCHVESVMVGEEVVGSLYVVANVDDVNAQIRDYFIIAALMSSIAILVAFVIAVLLQGIISGPIVDLAHVADHIRQHEDYTVRVSLDREDEIGGLYLAFNALLQQIEASKQELSEANDQLSVLLVEDGNTNRMMVKLLLKRHNVRVTEAENG